LTQGLSPVTLLLIDVSGHRLLLLLLSLWLPLLLLMHACYCCCLSLC